MNLDLELNDIDVSNAISYAANVKDLYPKMIRVPAKLIPVVHDILSKLVKDHKGVIIAANQYISIMK